MSATITTTPGDFLELVAVIAAMTPFDPSQALCERLVRLGCKACSR